MENMEKLEWISDLAENSSIVLYSIKAGDKRLPFEFVSKNVSQYRYDQDDFLSGGLTIAAIIHPDDLEESLSGIEKFFKDNDKAGACFQNEFRVLAGDGQVYWVENSVKAVRSKTDRCLHYQGTLIDITKRKRMEEELALANIVVENSSVILYRLRLDEGWPVEYISKNISHYGYAAEDFMSGKLPFSSIVYPDDYKRVSNSQRGFTKQIINRFLKHEYRIITKGGEIRWVEDISEVVRSFFASSTHFQGTLIDITERKQSEETIKANIAEMKKLNDFMVERELKMIKLKSKIKQLEDKLKSR